MAIPSSVDRFNAMQNASSNKPLRRSSRQTIGATLGGSDKLKPPPEMVADKPSPTSRERRRNPKRKASEATNQLVNLKGDLLDEALTPLSSKEIEEWEGWVELESEPAFFNIMLRNLGVKDVKAQEIFTVDQDSLDAVPQPVLGLVFLFQYSPGMDESDCEDESGEVWFANQTTDNACATVALLNIIMNAREVEVGDRLQEFKSATRKLSTPLRGHELSNNGFIRVIHNSLTRRMDHLNADMCLENEAAKATLKKAKKRSGRSRREKARNSRRKRPAVEYGFHFIAYVPADGYVWELDGLRSKPRRIGPLHAENWTAVARPRIESRMLRYEENELAFNLLALCQSPLAQHTSAIVSAMACIQYLDSQMTAQNDYVQLIAIKDPVLDLDGQLQLSEFQLERSEIEGAGIPQSLKDTISQSGFGIDQAYNMRQQFVLDLKAAMGEFRAELAALAEDEQRVNGRKKDYARALHRWVQKLAEKGVLEQIIENS